MGARLPGAPDVPIYAGTNISQTITEAYQLADIQKVIDALDVGETLVMQVAGGAMSGSPGTSAVDFMVPAGSTVLVLGLVVGGSQMASGSTYDVDCQRYIDGSLGVFVSGVGVDVTFPALPAISTHVLRSDITVAAKGMLLYNPATTAKAGLRATLYQLAGGTVSGVVAVSLRAIVFPGNPFNARYKVV